MSDLVKRLAEGQHPVEVVLRPTKSVTALKECLDRGYVHVRFTQTRGGTELGVPIDPQRTDITGADFEQGTGQLRIAGRLSLDFTSVDCVAEIDLATLGGTGHLVIVDDSSASVHAN